MSDVIATAGIATFWAPGIPAPKGSWKALWNKHLGRCIQVADNSKAQKAWCESLVVAARSSGVPFIHDGPVAVHATFFLSRPKSSSVHVAYPAKKPDLDKLERALLDAMTGVAYTDDKQVVDLRGIKRYENGRGPGAEVAIWPIEGRDVPLLEG